MTRARKFNQFAHTLIGRWALLCAVLVLVAGLFAVAYLHASAAAERAKQTADCVNNLLGTRAVVQQKDTDADRAFLAAVVKVFNDAPGSKAQAVDGEALRKQAVASYRIKVADQEFRDAHPLGRC